MKSSVNDIHGDEGTGKEDSGNNKTKKAKEQAERDANPGRKALDSLAKVPVDDAISVVNMLDVDTANAVRCIMRLDTFFFRMRIIQGDDDGDLWLKRNYFYSGFWPLLPSLCHLRRVCLMQFIMLHLSIQVEPSIILPSCL
jgi:hypothetical protein